MENEEIDYLFTFLSTGYLEKKILEKMEVQWANINKPQILEKRKDDVYFELENGIRGSWNWEPNSQDLYFWWGKRGLRYENGKLRLKKIF